jgi:hypothetical protein
MRSAQKLLRLYETIHNLDLNVILEVQDKQEPVSKPREVLTRVPTPGGVSHLGLSRDS